MPYPLSALDHDIHPRADRDDIIWTRDDKGYDMKIC